MTLYPRKVWIIATAMVFTCLISVAQDESGDKFNLKERGLKVRENLGKAVLKVMTSKTNDLSLISAKAQYVVGMYPLYTDASDVDYYPENIEEGDHVLTLILMKNQGIGVYELDGTVTYNGQPLQYLGGGAYMIEIDPNDHSEKVLEVRTSSGKKATVKLNYIPQIQLKKVNGEESLPVIDLSKDLTFEYGPKYEDDKSEIRLAMMTDVAGARGWNQFQTLKERDGEIKVPSESYSNTQISSSAGTVKFIDGNNFLLAERRKIIESSDIPDKGDFANLEIQSISYHAMPVIVTGKVDKRNASYILMRQNLGTDHGDVEIEISKPNAITGMPLSKASRFGLATLSVSGTTLKTTTTSSTRYTSMLNNSQIITTVTTTYQFPQLPSSDWQKALDIFYGNLKTMMLSEFNIKFADVDSITSAAAYRTFPTTESNSESFVSETYRETKRTQPSKLGEIFANVSTNMTTDQPDINLMKETSTDGLVNIEIHFNVAANNKGNIVLIPEVTLNMSGRNETGNNEPVVYGKIVIRGFDGVPFNSDAVKSNPKALYNVLRGDDLIFAIKYSMIRLQEKERELGFEKIWELR